MWDFSTEPEFEAKLGWMREFMAAEVYPLEALEGIGEEDFGRVLTPLREQVKEQGLWAGHLPPEHGGYLARNWRRKQAWGGSYLLDKVCHDFDIFGRLAGARAAKVASQTGRKTLSNIGTTIFFGVLVRCTGGTVRRNATRAWRSSSAMPLNEVNGCTGKSRSPAGRRPSRMAVMICSSVQAPIPVSRSGVMLAE